MTQHRAHLLRQIPRHQVARADAAGQRAQEDVAVAAQRRAGARAHLEAVGGDDDGLAHAGVGGHPSTLPQDRPDRDRRCAMTATALLLLLAPAAEPAWTTAWKKGPLSAAETRTFMKELTRYVEDNHLKKDPKSP